MLSSALRKQICHNGREETLVMKNRMVSFALGIGMALCVLSLGSGVARAQSISVTGNVQAECHIATNPTLAFTYNLVTNGGASGADVTPTTSPSVTCAGSTVYKMALGAGANWDGTNHRRQMTDGSSHYLYYGLYQDGSDVTAWGDGTAATNSAAVEDISGAISGGSGTASIPVYGLAPHAQTPPAGAYTDSVAITFSFS
jgi:spore coat protein U-like protein